MHHEDTIAFGRHVERDERSAALLEEFRAEPDHERRQTLMTELVELHMDLCDSLARRFGRRGIDQDDLVQVARLALVKAIQRHRPDAGRSFTAYAIPTISGELKRHFRDCGWAVRPPRRLQELRIAMRGHAERATQELGRVPGRGDLAHLMQVSPALVAQAEQVDSSYRPDSLELVSGDHDARALVDVLGEPDADVEMVPDRLCLGQALSSLTEEERELLWLRFVDGLTQRAISERLGVSQMQVSRKLARIIGTLRTSMDADAAGLDAAQTAS